MKEVKISVLMAAAVCLAAVPVSGQAGADVSGRWQLTLPPPPMGGGQGRQDGGQQQRQRPEQEGERPDGPPAVILVLEQNGERLTGTAEAEQGNVQFENGTIKGETVTLTLTLVGPDGRELALTLQGNVDGDSIAGTMEGGPAGRGGGRGGGGGGPGWQAQRVN
jgi:hypothetical protein